MTSRKTRRVRSTPLIKITYFEPLESRSLLSATLADITVHPNVSILPAATARTSPVGYSPSQIKSAYGFDAVQGTGAGQTIAIIDAYNDPNLYGDLSVFSSTFGLPQADLAVVNQTGGAKLPKADAGWAGEIALDVEWAHAIAPGAQLLLVEASSSSLSDLLTAVDYARSVSSVTTISMSWGTSEFYTESSYDSHFTTPAGHQGITFVAASGDTGVYYGPDWPATSPNVLAVGGTTLNISSTGGATFETPWDDSTGGTSRFEYAPSYQSAASSSVGRSSPDVSFNADPRTGFAVYDTVPYQGSSGWESVGGTSAGAPQWAALIAIANQVRAAQGQPSLDGATGTMPALYAMYAAPGSASYAHYTSAFNDIETTETVITRAPWRIIRTRHGYMRVSGGYTMTTETVGGYDTVTGLGTPKAQQVINGLAGAKTGNSVAPASPAAKALKALKKTRASEVANRPPAAANVVLTVPTTVTALVAETNHVTVAMLEGNATLTEATSATLLTRYSAGHGTMENHTAAGATSEGILASFRTSVSRSVSGAVMTAATFSGTSIGSAAREITAGAATLTQDVRDAAIDFAAAVNDVWGPATATIITSSPSYVMPAAVVAAAAAVAAAYAANQSAKARRENMTAFNVIYPIDDDSR